MQTTKFRVEGTKPLQITNSRLANPYDEYTQRINDLSLQRKKLSPYLVDEDSVWFRKYSRLWWEGSLYYDDELGPYVPSEWIRSSIIKGAGSNETMRAIDVQQSVHFFGEKEHTFGGGYILPLHYDGPRDLDGLWEDGSFADIFILRLSPPNSPLLKWSRPVFNDWALEFTAASDGLSQRGLIRCVQEAGAHVGLGDGRSLGFGRWKVTHIDGEAVAEDRFGLLAAA